MIKRAKKGSKQGALEFKTEIELLSRVHHMNLVRLVSFCYEKGEQILIYEYVSNGTLAEMLSSVFFYDVILLTVENIQFVVTNPYLQGKWGSR